MGFCNKINIAREKEVVALHLYKVVVKVRKMILFVYGCVCVRRQKKKHRKIKGKATCSNLQEWRTRIGYTFNEMHV